MSRCAARRRITVVAVLSAGVFACTANDSGRDSTIARISPESSTTKAPRLASDATLSLLDAAGLDSMLRIAADSFAAHEAVRIISRPTTSEQIADMGSRDERPKTPDLIVTNDIAAFTRQLIPGRATWFAAFATDRIVIAYRDSLPARLAIDSTNWRKVLLRRGVRTARTGPGSDPSGERALLVMQLAEQHYKTKGLAAKLSSATPSALIRPNQRELIQLLRTDSADFAWLQESDAAAAGLQMLRLPAEIDLGQRSDSILYAAARVTIPGLTPRDSITGTDSVTANDAGLLGGAAIVFAISIPIAAPNARIASRFVHFLLSDEGRRIMREAHLEPLARTVAVGRDIPALVAASVDTVLSTPDSAAAAGPPRGGNQPGLPRE